MTKRTTLIRPLTAAAIAVTMALTLVACAVPPAPPTRAPGPTIRIGTKDFAEQFILGEMYALLLENAGFRVERRFDLGPTDAAHAALLSGEIDFYPEYTGTGLLTVLKAAPPTGSDNDAAKVFDAVAKGYRDRFDLIWLSPAPANNAQAVAMTKPGAARLRIVTLSDFVARAKERAAQGRRLILAGLPEFLQREDGLPGLQRAYGDFEVDFRPIAAAERYRLLLTDEVDAVVAFGTDGELGGFDLATLIDDKAFFPPYNVAPVVRGEVLRRNPRIKNVLDALAPRLNGGVMRDMNFEVTNQGAAPQAVARRFLIGEGLIPGPREARAVNYVGAYRIVARDGLQRIKGQATVALKPGGAAAVTWVAFVTDTLQTTTGRGQWTPLGDTVVLTITESAQGPLQPPAIAKLTFDDHFIVSVEVTNDPTGQTEYAYLIVSGDRTPAIRELHERLARIPWLNFTDPGPSGDAYGEATRQAVVAFQSSQNLLPTGVVDVETWRALGNPAPPGGVNAPLPAPTYAPPATPMPGGLTRSPRGQGRTRAWLRLAAAHPSQACTPTITIGDAATNLRQSPSTGSPVLTVIPAGTAMEGTGVNADRTWYRVNYFGTAGWVFAELVIAECVQDLPVVDAPIPAPAQPAQPQPAQPGDLVLYLSFDDGPHPTWTPQVLEVLQQNNAKATFFQIGQQIGAFSDVMQQLIVAGMGVGNHTWSHPSLAGIARDEFVSQVTRTHEAQVATGAPEGPSLWCMRPPYGATDANTRPWAAELGYTVVLWTIDPQDWALPGTQQIINHILTHARPGAILLSHDGGGNRSQTVDAYRVALPQLAAQGYRFEAIPCMRMGS
ncbi:MAG: glycine betaine ABC transporter substrate-binding protein [Anaerolineae bacterium]|nr:polysaccharide deacetylase family protein [Candidatus Roseilinea sp.]MDW8451669.1 glycine betaine ABC transporter substrate-binding protein [Anaerolineae bacterium]